MTPFNSTSGSVAVLIAVIGATVTLCGILLNYRLTRQARSDTKESVDFLRGNGKGTMLHLVEELHDGQARVEVKMDNLLKWQVEHDIKHQRTRKV